MPAPPKAKAAMATPSATNLIKFTSFLCSGVYQRSSATDQDPDSLSFAFASLRFVVAQDLYEIRAAPPEGCSEFGFALMRRVRGPLAG